jgi:hypothetical protein
MKAATLLTIGPVRADDVKRVREVVDAALETPLLKERERDNVNGPPPTFSKNSFWFVLVGCLLTTQQRSTRGSPVDRFLATEPFPLALSGCKADQVGAWVEDEIKRFGGIRRGPTIGRQAAANWQRLQSGEWHNAEKVFNLLLAQRKRSPVSADKDAERVAASWSDAIFDGLGPKQGRNLWQWLGLTRYETPLDSRVANWINKNLSVRVDKTKLPNSRYYEALMDHVQALCEAAGVLPCIFDAAAFRYDDDQDAGDSTKSSTTLSGYVNRHDQVVIRNTGLPGTDHLQFVYQLGCTRCGHVYGANGSDIHERRCPSCGGGKPGLQYA